MGTTGMRSIVMFLSKTSDLFWNAVIGVKVLQSCGLPFFWEVHHQPQLNGHWLWHLFCNNRVIRSLKNYANILLFCMCYSYRVYCMLGDGECAEGSVWEAMAFASHYKLDNLVAVIDVNRLGQSEPTSLQHDMETYRKRCEAFGSVPNFLSSYLIFLETLLGDGPEYTSTSNPDFTVLFVHNTVSAVNKLKSCSCGF